MGTERAFLDGRVTLHSGDCIEVLAGMPEAHFDSIVCDPPYGLEFMGKEWDGANGFRRALNPADTGRDNAFGQTSKRGPEYRPGNLFQDWCLVWAVECLRVLKPGGHLVAFGGTRTYHRLASAVEDAGFDVRDQIGWCYGSGFPKSRNLHGEHEGWGTALKPAWEPIVLARKPLDGTVLDNVEMHGTGAINIDGCRVHTTDGVGGEYTVTRLKPGATLNATGGNWRPDDGVKYHGDMKPGRWPANIVHDGSGEVLEAFPLAPGQQRDLTGNEPSRPAKNVYGEYKECRVFKARRDGEASAGKRYTECGATNFAALPGARREGAGSAARFFYAAKADSDDRLGSKHPTVKPVDLMQWLVRLVTPKGGVVLDPFAGTGTTGEAAWREGMNAILIEREPEYQADIARRMELAENPTKRAAVAKSDNKLDQAEDLPLFAGRA